MEIELTSSSQPNLCNIEWKIVTSVPATMFHWELETYTEGSVKEFDIGLNLTAVRDMMEDIIKIIELEEDCLGSMCVEEEKPVFLYRFYYQKPTFSSYNLTLQSPSRTVQAEAKYSPSEVGLKVYPNKGDSEVKYEVTAKSSYDYWNQQNKYEGLVSHPSLTKDMRLTVQVKDSGERLEGSFEADVFPDTQDNITGVLKSTWIANNTIKIEADLHLRVWRIFTRVSHLNCIKTNV